MPKEFVSNIQRLRNAFFSLRDILTSPWNANGEKRKTWFDFGGKLRAGASYLSITWGDKRFVWFREV